MHYALCTMHYALCTLGRYKNQSLNIVAENSFCLFWDPYEKQKKYRHFN